MAAVTVKMDFSDIDEGMKKMLRRGINPRKLFSRQRKLLRKDQKEHFDQMRSTAGSWPPRADASAQKIQGGKKKSHTKGGKLRKPTARRLRNQLGRLKTFWKISVKQELGLAALQIQSGAKWSDVHQDGGVAGRGSRIPKREFVWISDEFLKQFTDDYLKEVVAQWG